MIFSKLVSSINEEYHQVVSVLSEKGLLRDYIPYRLDDFHYSKHNVIKYGEITWGQKNSNSNILFDEDKSCSEIIGSLQIDKQYSILLYDRSIIQAEYVIKNDEIARQRLVFIKRQNKVWEIEELREISEDPELLDESLNANIGIPILIRLDYDPENHINLEHPKAHMIISNVRNCRLPMKTNLSLGQFVEFIFLQFYSRKIVIPYKLNHDSLISEGEKKLLHINW